MRSVLILSGVRPGWELPDGREINGERMSSGSTPDSSLSRWEARISSGLRAQMLISSTLQFEILDTIDNPGSITLQVSYIPAHC